MFRQIRRHWRRFLRTGALLAFALCLAVQPVLSALGEMHEFTAHADSAAPHQDHVAPHGHGDADAGDVDDSGSALHLLLHYAHCCGHSVGLALAYFAPLLVPAASSALLPPSLPSAPAARLSGPFRPPIRA